MCRQSFKYLAAIFFLTFFSVLNTANLISVSRFQKVQASVITLAGISQAACF